MSIPALPIVPYIFFHSLNFPLEIETLNKILAEIALCGSEYNTNLRSGEDALICIQQTHFEKQ